MAAPIVVGLALPGGTGPPMGATAGGAATGPSLWCFLRGSSRSVVGLGRAQLSILVLHRSVCVSLLPAAPPELLQGWQTSECTAAVVPR